MQKKKQNKNKSRWEESLYFNSKKKNIGQVSLFKSQFHEERNTGKVKEDDNFLIFSGTALVQPPSLPRNNNPPTPSPRLACVARVRKGRGRDP